MAFFFAAAKCAKSKNTMCRYLSRAVIFIVFSLLFFNSSHCHSDNCEGNLMSAFAFFRGNLFLCDLLVTVHNVSQGNVNHSMAPQRWVWSNRLAQLDYSMVRYRRQTFDFRAKHFSVVCVSFQSMPLNSSASLFVVSFRFRREQNVRCNFISFRLFLARYL